jgi:hypothetical protein
MTFGHLHRSTKQTEQLQRRVDYYSPPSTNSAVTSAKPSRFCSMVFSAPWRSLTPVRVMAILWGNPCVNQNVPLDARHFFASIITFAECAIGVLDALRINDAWRYVPFRYGPRQPDFFNAYSSRLASLSGFSLHNEKSGESLFLRKLVLGLPAQASSKNHATAIACGAPAVLRPSP